MDRRGFLRAIPAVAIARRLPATEEPASASYLNSRVVTVGSTLPAVWSIQNKQTGKWLNANGEWQSAKHMFDSRTEFGR